MKGRIWLAGVCAFLFGACGGAGEERALVRLERLVFVPPRACVLLPETNEPVDCSNPRALLVDRFEVTQEEWQAWLSTLDAESLVHQSSELWPSHHGSHPATGMTLGEARDFAALEGMRLPTAREWLRVAVGTRAQYFPWGKGSRESVANTLELRLEALAPVGSFESGRTPAGVYDLLGNAREWVLDDLMPLEERSKERAWAMGGSFLSRKRATYWLDEAADLDRDGRVEGNTSYNVIHYPPISRGRDVGMRLIADAEDWLREHARHWDTDRGTQARLEQVGENWGSSAIPLLKRLSAEADAGPGLMDLLRGASK